MLRYGSVCSGIEAATVAWKPIGWTAAFFAEIEPFPRAVLKHHYPDVALHGDFTTIGSEDYGAIDLLVGGTPCQDFSVAGLRAGLAGDRGQLTIEYVRLAERLRPKWLVWENVPGVLSADGGRAFGAFLGLLGQCGYGFAYRVLDAQYCGVPQRRRRVFLVGCLGDWRSAAAVLFDAFSLSGHPAPRREAGTIASALTANGVGAGGGPDDNAAQANHIVPAFRNSGQGFWSADQIAANLGGSATRSVYESTLVVEDNYVAHTLKAEGFDASEDGTGRGVPLVPVAFGLRGREDGAQPEVCGDGDTVGSLRAASGGSSRDYVAFSCKDHGADARNVAPTLRAMHHAASHANAGGQIAVATRSAVRRLTPVECERLQGFPDGWTAVPYRGKPAADGPRYRALGNSMAVPCMEWIGERIAAVETMGLDHAC